MENPFYIDLAASRYLCIGTSTQTEGVSHVVAAEYGQIQCLMCNTGPIRPRNAQYHFQSERHQKRHALVNSVQRKDRTRSELLAHNLQGALVEHIDHGPWRSVVKCSMYEFLMRFQSIDQCHQVFAKVLRMESMSLLELALWKAKICDDLTFSSMHEMRVSNSGEYL